MPRETVEVILGSIFNEKPETVNNNQIFITSPLIRKHVIQGF